MADCISAASGDDLIYGFIGNDTIDGGDGLDKIVFSGTAASVNAMVGSLNLTLDSQLVSVECIDASAAQGGVQINLSLQSEGFNIVGSNYSDTLTGGQGADSIFGGASNDTINGFVGADTIDGGAGSNTLLLTATSTRLNVASDSQIRNVGVISAAGARSPVTINLTTQTESFSITGSIYADTLIGGSGNDTFVGFVGGDMIVGGAGYDTFVLAGNAVSLNLTLASLNVALDTQLSSIDRIDASMAMAGVQLNLSKQSEGFMIIGSNFSDTLTGGAGADSISGGTFNDVINGFVGADTVNGGYGSNSLMLASTSTSLNTAADGQLLNIGTVSAATATGSVVINLTNQREGLTIIGGSYSDTLTGGAWVDLLSGGGGNDVIIDFVGDDSVDGGAGSDTLMLTGTSAALNSATNNQLINVETVSGALSTRGVIINLSNQIEAFYIVGSSYGDALTGGFGSDTIVGGLGNDFLTGGKGNDTLNGNGGADIFVFNALLGPTNVDRIVSFSALDDRIWLDHSCFSGLNTGGLSAGAFNTVASQADDRIIFNTITGALSFDQDGSGSAVAVQFATLSGGWIGTLSAANFYLI